jgi:beta-1,4-mannosyl-glycoprotein beta-1,4-N-acetylglucosaminyltransferase
MIFDCFMFFNELELLEVRLDELYDSVDHFVLLECMETFRGKPKPLYYTANKQRFKKYAPKIIHLTSSHTVQTTNPWDREIFQRNLLMHGLKMCQPDDIILISDADEILRPSAIGEIQRLLEPDEERVVLCQMAHYRYFLDRQAEAWPGTLAIRYKYLRSPTDENYEHSPNWYRYNREKSPHVIPNAGWHFCYMGGRDRVITKLGAFSHSDCDTPERRSSAGIAREYEHLPRVPIDESFPRMIVQRQKHWKETGFIEP